MCLKQECTRGKGARVSGIRACANAVVCLRRYASRYLAAIAAFHLVRLYWLQMRRYKNIPDALRLVVKAAPLLVVDFFGADPVLPTNERTSR